MTPSRKKANRKGTRELLLKAAREELIAGNGDLEVANVSKRAGVSAGLTFYHFGNKSGLLNAIVNDFYRKLDDSIVAVQFDGETWAEREQARVHAMVEMYYQDPVAVLVATRLRSDPAYASEEAQRAKRLDQLGAKNIAQAQRGGEIDKHFDPLLLVSMLLAGVTSGVCSALSRQPPLPLEEAQQQIWCFVERAVGLDQNNVE